MASSLTQAPSFFCIVLALLAIFSFPDYCSCFNPRSLVSYNTSKAESGWSPAGATWYGNAIGPGTDGGACGYQNSVAKPPYSSMVSAGGPSLFKSGKGCGACYQVKCTDNVACSGNPVTITIADSCPGCTAESVHFDMSGTSFGAMAKLGQADQLRNAGQLTVRYRRVRCNYGATKLAFHVELGSNPYYFAVAMEFEDGNGDLRGVDLRQKGSQIWISMDHLWGAVWKLGYGSQLQAPFSLRLTTLQSGEKLVVSDVIPAGWKPGVTYSSRVNYSIKSDDNADDESMHV